jgi:anti-sigma factor RsiW
MNSEHLSQEQLQRGYDGDLSSQEAAELRRHLSTCPACQAEFDAIGRLGQLVRWAARDALAPEKGVQPEAAGLPDFDRMFAAIQVAIAQPEAAQPTAADAPIPITRARPQRPHRTPRWLTRSAPALGAVALAAAALLMVVRTEPPVPNDANTVATNETDVPITTVNGLRSEVVEANFGNNGGQVFDIPMSDGTPIPVVWIDDDDDDEE